MKSQYYLVTPTLKTKMAFYIFFLTDYIKSNFDFNTGVPKYYLDFFNSLKYRISVFYMREHTELVYVLQNRVEKSIVYYF